MGRYLLSVLLFAVTAASINAGQFTPRVAYRGLGDSPFHDFGVDGTLLVEDFEDGLLNLPGVTLLDDTSIHAGRRFIGSGFSVAADSEDGAEGRSLEAKPSICTATFPEQCPARVHFAFDDQAFGTLPTYAGFAWTDAVRGSDQDVHPIAHVKVFEADGTASDLVIRHLPARSDLPDRNADDIFVGFMNEQGIASLEVLVVSTLGEGGHLALDHLQIGVASLQGDADRDGSVTFRDFSELADVYPMFADATWATGDFNLDRQVTFPDFMLLSGNFGQHLQVDPAAVVPEPTSAILWLVALLAILGISRRAK